MQVESAESNQHLNSEPSNQNSLNENLPNEPELLNQQETLFIEQDYYKVFGTSIYDEANWKQCTQQSSRGKFRLIEDIAMIYFIGTDKNSKLDSETLGIKCFEKLKQEGFFPSRSVEALRDRYKRYLSCLNSNDIDKIGRWVIENGVLDGFLEFSFSFEEGKLKMVRKLERIIKVKMSYQSDQDTEVEDQEKENKAPQNEQQVELLKTEEKQQFKIKTEQQEITIDSYEFPAYFLKPLQANRQKIWQQGPFDLFLNEQMFCAQANYREVEVKIKTNFEGNREIVQDAIKSEQELFHQIEKICDQFALTRDGVLDYLEAVSGCFPDLIYFLKTGDQAILWLEDEDQVLKQVESQEDPALKLIMRQKGEEKIRNRLKYKKIKFPFEF